MKSRTLTCITAMTLFVALATPSWLSAQHTRYKLIDIGTLGGPSAHGPGNGHGSQLLNNAGIVAGSADTSIPDPNAPNCANPDCFLSHAFRWEDGVLTDLGTLPGGNNSGASSINARGWIAGGSTTAEIDPFNTACDFQPLCPQFHGVLWKDGEIIDIGTLGEGLESNTTYVNNAGEVVGFSTINTSPDPFSFLGAPTHAFIWRNGVMRDLGTLGGPDPTRVSVGERNDAGHPNARGNICFRGMCEQPRSGDRRIKSGGRCGLHWFSGLLRPARLFLGPRNPYGLGNARGEFLTRGMAQQ